MKNKIIQLYKVFLTTYHFKQKKDMNEAKRLAYVAIRNGLGTVVFTTFMVFLSVFEHCFYGFGITSNRVKFYPIVALVIVSHLLLCMKYLKPIFDYIEINEVSEIEIKKNNYIYIGYIACLGLYAGLTYVVARLLPFYLCK